jgi:dTDP-4-amino-4,6-dideoxygalactose transaminase
LQKPFVELGHTAGECPVAEEAFERYVTLPVHPRMTDEAVDYMTQCIIKILGK